MKKRDKEKIIITGSDSPNSWYKNYEGEMFTVSYISHNGYAIKYPKGGVKVVKFGDCKIWSELSLLQKIFFRILKTMEILIPIVGMAFFLQMGVYSMTTDFRETMDVTPLFTTIFQISSFLIFLIFYCTIVEYGFRLLKK